MKEKQKNIILLLVILVIVASIVFLQKSKVSPPRLEIDTETRTITKDGYILAPELTGISGYINAEEGMKISDFRGKVVLIDFWTYTCINCIRTFPFLKEWDKKYKDKGLVIIGVHTPEFDFEKKRENVVAAMEDNGLEYRVVQDNDYATWRAYKNRFWPRKYLIDAEGFIRYDHIGEGAYDVTEAKIRELLAEIDENVENVDMTNIEEHIAQGKLTPEVYAGYSFALSRGQNIGNSGGLRTDEVFNYSLLMDDFFKYPLPLKIKFHIIYIDGTWTSNPDDLRGSGAVILGYTASNVNIVAEGDSSRVNVLLDDEFITPKFAGKDVQFEDGEAFIIIDEPRLYNLVKGDYGAHALVLTSDDEFSFNAFTFG